VRVKAEVERTPGNKEAGDREEDRGQGRLLYGSRSRRPA
jgi:hypothetical protein